MKKYFLISLGCPKNLVDSEIFSGILKENSFSSTDNIYEADIILINTCGFINDAKKESIDVILNAIEVKTANKIIVVTGCLVKRYKEELKKEFKEIDYFIDLKDFKSFSNIFKIEKFSFQRNLLTPKHYAYLRISDGCQNFCSFCAIPYIRGKLISRPMEEILSEANFLAKSGVKELIVIAQDTTQYGVDLYGKSKLCELLEKLNEINKFFWIRVLYMHPDHITQEIIQTINKLPKVCKYFEIPFQHSSSKILQKMNRKKERKELQNLIDEIRNSNPQAVIRTTFITGFPSEDQKDFAELKEFVEKNKFEKLGVFAYSKEEDTKAYEFSKEVSLQTKEKRKNEIMALQKDISKENLQKYKEQILPVIIDEKIKNEEFSYIGRSEFDCPDIDGVVFLKGKNHKVGDIVNCQITNTLDYDLEGKIIN